ncbi:hypothetical protein ANN_12706 [Periplaneta americana]|uniref:Uncharacterized protein n=1 Tax=Periplaneta americana TaxID=6978 RepID=A0ABQ8THH2_PERAM|nr:hypothetical protein ANN_12706 [Periplaneta americana]
MADLCEGGNEPPGSLKAILLETVPKASEINAVRKKATRLWGFAPDDPEFESNAVERYFIGTRNEVKLKGSEPKATNPQVQNEYCIALSHSFQGDSLPPGRGIESAHRTETDAQCARNFVHIALKDGRFLRAQDDSNLAPFTTHNVILVADVIYDNDVTEAFVNTLQKILSFPPAKTIYIALEKSSPATSPLTPYTRDAEYKRSANSVCLGRLYQSLDSEMHFPIKKWKIYVKYFPVAIEPSFLLLPITSMYGLDNSRRHVVAFGCLGVVLTPHLSFGVFIVIDSQPWRDYLREWDQNEGSVWEAAPAVERVNELRAPSIRPLESVDTGCESARVLELFATEDKWIVGE